MSTDAQYRQTPEDVGRMYVRNDKGEMIPLSAFAKIKYKETNYIFIN